MRWTALFLCLAACGSAPPAVVVDPPRASAAVVPDPVQPVAVPSPRIFHSRDELGAFAALVPEDFDFGTRAIVTQGDGLYSEPRVVGMPGPILDAPGITIHGPGIV